MEKVFCQRITNPGFSLFTLMLPVTKPQVWINLNVERMKRMAPHGVSKTQKKNNKKTTNNKNKSFLSFRCPAVICGGRERRGPGPPAAGSSYLLPCPLARLPARVNVSKLLQLRRVTKKKRGPGSSSQERRGERGEGGREEWRSGNPLE